MRKHLFVAAVAVMALVAVPVQAQNSRIVEDGGTGPYKAIMQEVPTLTTHTIFQPQDLSKFGKDNLLPVVVWGNGGSAESPSGHINFLNEVASQGFLVVAIGPSNYQQVEPPRPGQTGDVPRMGGGMPGGMGGGMPQMGGPRPQGAPQGQGGAQGQRPQGAPQGMRPQGQGAPQGAAQGPRPQGQGGMPRMGGGMPGGMGGGMSMGDPAGLVQALEWAIAQNADKDSPYYGKLDIENIAAAGMSCGGLQALHMSRDARIKTIMAMNSGYFGSEDSMDKASLASMKQKSVIWIMGGTTDIAWENGNDDFRRMSGTMPAVLCSLEGIGHGGTYMQPHGGDYAKVATAWLKWWLKDDKEAARMFTGSEPGVGKMQGWSYQRKNIQ